MLVLFDIFPMPLLFNISVVIQHKQTVAYSLLSYINMYLKKFEGNNYIFLKL